MAIVILVLVFVGFIARVIVFDGVASGVGFIRLEVERLAD